MIFFLFQRYVAYTGNNMRKLSPSPEKEKDNVSVELPFVTDSQFSMYIYEGISFTLLGCKLYRIAHIFSFFR